MWNVWEWLELIKKRYIVYIVVLISPTDQRGEADPELIERAGSFPTVQKLLLDVLGGQAIHENVRFQFTPLREGLQQKSTIFLSVFCCFLFIKYIFQKLILSNSKFNQYRPYICTIFIAPISWDFMYGKYMRKIL